MGEEVWNGIVDGTWRVQVSRLEAYKGELTVTRIPDNNEIHKQEVGLSYEARFGPDVADVGEWQDIAIKVIDKYYAEHNMPIPPVAPGGGEG